MARPRVSKKSCRALTLKWKYEGKEEKKGEGDYCTDVKCILDNPIFG